MSALAEPQEYFLEELVRSGQFWVTDDGSYGVTSGKSLVEFFCADPAISAGILRQLQKQAGLSTALVKSFDGDFKQACAALGWTGSVGAFLFRERHAYAPTVFPDADKSAAQHGDLDELWEINHDFFESRDEIAALADSNKLWTVRVGGKIAGCGLSNRFHEESPAVDIGMMVAPGFRRKGLGTHIVIEMANRAEQAGLRPICGCAASNAASKATLEKAGFVSAHQLMSFAV
ncbi:GNAT family N-acetyltransferase [Pseudaestuariivita sp.]|uniref:GNAT family N-acetyltransferase n=1 Tax=Pseudaestuariivita sp. TaxID=2211669 RepID=UPI0040595FB1